MNLQDTVEMMLSDDYKERFKAEYYQLQYRCERLNDFIERYSNGSLNFKPTCDIDTLQMQLFCMKSYMHMLVIRAEMEGIIL